jgi:hypothetical protein
MVSLHDDPAAARAMGDNARRLAWQFDRPVAVQSYYDLFSSLLPVARAA